MARLARRAKASSGLARYGTVGTAGMARRGEARSGEAWTGTAGVARRGKAWPGEARVGIAGTARQGLALLGAAWSGWRSWAWLRTKGGGISCPQPFF